MLNQIVIMAANLQTSPALKTAPSPRSNLRLVHRERRCESALAANRNAVLAYLTLGKDGNENLLRKAMRAAAGLGGDFFAVYVDTPRIVSGLGNPRTLIDDLVMAGALGAKIVWLESRDPAAALLEFANKSGVARIFVARSEPSLLQRPVYQELLNRGDGFAIDVVGFEHAAIKQSAGA
jgi:K+-sensing histidine kinase KdpD